MALIFQIPDVQADLNLPLDDYYLQINNDSLNLQFQDADSEVKNIDLTKLKSLKNGYGYWLWSRDMYDVNLTGLSDGGVKHIFLHSDAFERYGEKEVLNWIENANNHGINVHIWMQVFYDGEWVPPVDSNGTFNYKYFNEKIGDAKYYASLDSVYGVQLDYIRFDGTAGQHNNSTESISYFIKSAHDEIKKVNPDIVLSATVMPEPEMDIEYYGQDIKDISKNVDILVPMIYKGNYEQNSAWIENTTEWFVNNSDADVWCGIQSYESDDNLTGLNESEITNDAESCLDGGADSIVLFRWGINNNTDRKGLKLI